MSATLGSRALFPRLVAKAYCNHAAISPPSQPVLDVVTEVAEDYARKGVDGFFKWLERREAFRPKLAELIGAERGDDIAFAANTTRCITAVAMSVPWRRGDRVVLIEGEFPANVTPWQRAAEHFGLELVWLPKPTADNVTGAWLEKLETLLRDGVRMVAVSVVQFQTGLRMPMEAIGELCRRHHAELCVDAIQACGVVPVNAKTQHFDYLAAGSHKWMMGLEGVAMLYAAPERAAQFRPLLAGWLSHDKSLGFLFKGPGHLRYDRPFVPTAQVIEGGISNTIGCAALEASVGCIQAIGVEAIHDHVDRYGAALENKLTALDFRCHRAADRALRSGICSFTPPADVDVVALHAAIDPTVVSCAIPDGLLRFSPHWPNALTEVDIIADEIERAVSDVRANRAPAPPST